MEHGPFLQGGLSQVSWFQFHPVESDLSSLPDKRLVTRAWVSSHLSTLFLELLRSKLSRVNV